MQQEKKTLPKDFSEFAVLLTSVKSPIAKFSKKYLPTFLSLLPSSPAVSKALRDASMVETALLGHLVAKEGNGLVKHWSTATNLLNFTNFVAKCLNSRKLLHVVCTKAFYSVNRTILLSKHPSLKILLHYMARLLRLFFTNNFTFLFTVTLKSFHL